MDIITSIASKTGELLVEPAGRQLAYTIFYQGNIKALVDETKKLKDQRAGMQLLMDADIRNLKVILPEVLSWVEKVDKIVNELERFLEEEVKASKMCLNGWFPNLKLRHFLGRKAKKYAEDVSKLQQEGKFEKISSAPPTTRMHLSSSMKAFESRTKILNQVMEALKDETIHTIAICGMGGIGKTTIAKEVARRAKEEKLFEDVVMAVVAQNPSVMKIQEEIADMLHLRLTAKSTIGRADELSNRIKNITKILIVLDDIWDRLELDAVGIPYGSEHTGCSILLTSRNMEACTQMRSQRNFTIQVLSDGEAWNLFEEAAGTSVNTPDLHPIAKQIAKECRGLPVAIVTVGRALESKGKDEWNDALHQLQNSTVENIFGMDAHVYSSIELSYKFLRSRQVQWCFLLCCLFPEDYDIPIETLVRYGKGLRKFQDTETMEESRSRVHSLIQTLKRRFLLIDSKEIECVKMHDVVRDVALSIANKEHGFVVRCANKIEDWPEIDRREDCTIISLVADEINARLDNLRCPNLKLLHLLTNRFPARKQQFEVNICDETKELKVLALENMRIRSLLFSLRVLRDMRTLHLEYCVFEDISSIGELVNLEVLNLRGSEIQSLPREIGRLEHLKLLDTTECMFNEISPGVLSSLIKLEELYMRDTISNWCLGQQNREEKICAILAELIPLSDHLKVLDFDLEEFQLLPENFVFNNLTRFRISICRPTRTINLFEIMFNIGQIVGLFFQKPSLDYFFRNQLDYSGDMDALKETGFGIHPLLEKCETLNLRTVKNLNKEWMDEVGFSRLKDLYLDKCTDVEYLVYTNSNLTDQLPFSLLENLKLVDVKLKALCHPDFLLQAATREFQLFHNLKCLVLGNCYELNYVFSTYLARGSFPQLQSLVVYDCRKMEGIVYKETEENGQNNIADDIQTIVFHKLTELKLFMLPLLISLYRDMDDNNAVQLCPSRNDIHHMTPKVPESPNVLVPFKILKWLPSLELLLLQFCHKVRVVLDFHGLIMITPLSEKEKTNNSEVIGGDDKEDDHFHGIDHRCWCLKCLPPLDRKSKSVQGNNNNTVQKKSQDDQIITTTSSHSDAQGEVRDHRVTEQVLYNLRDLEVRECDSVAIIFNFGEGQGSFPPVLSKLSFLKLNNLKELIHIWNIKNCPQQVITSSFQNLISLQITKCPRLRCLFPPSIAKLLVALESIDVRECKSIQVILAKNEEDENVNDVLLLSFLHLRSIYLEKLENLLCFSDQPNCAIQFPSLESVKISGCPKLETFVTAAAMSAEDTPKLKQVEDSDLPHPQFSKWQGDLNTTIKQNFGLKQEKLIQLEKQKQQKKTEAKQRQQNNIKQFLQKSENEIEQQEEQSSKNEIEQQEKQSSRNEIEQKEKRRQQEEQSSENEIEQQEEQSSENEIEQQEEQSSENEIEQQEEQSSENEIEQQEEQSSENEIGQQEEQSSENEIGQQEEQSSENEIGQQEKRRQQEEQSSENAIEQKEEQCSENAIEQQEEQCSENEIKQQEEQCSDNEIEQKEEQRSENEIEQEEQSSENKIEREEEQSFENEIKQEEEQSSENVSEQQEAQSSENEIEQQEEQSSENESDKLETQSSENEIEHHEGQSSENESDQQEAQRSENEIEQQERQSSENESDHQEARSSENEIEQQEGQSSENESDHQEAQSSENEIEQQEKQSSENEIRQHKE